MVLTACIFIGKCFPNGNVLLKVAMRLAGQYAGDIKTLPNFIIAFLITVWFLRLNEHHSKVINSLSKSVFSVYIVHQVPAFISFIWKRIFMADLWVPNHAAWYVVIVFFTLYFCCEVADVIRRKIELITTKSVIYNFFLRKIKNMYSYNLSGE